MSDKAPSKPAALQKHEGNPFLERLPEANDWVLLERELKTRLPKAPRRSEPRKIEKKDPSGPRLAFAESMSISLRATASGGFATLYKGRGTGEGDPIPDETLAFEGELSVGDSFSTTFDAEKKDVLWFINASTEATLTINENFTVPAGQDLILDVGSDGYVLLKVTENGTMDPSPFNIKVHIDRP